MTTQPITKLVVLMEDDDDIARLVAHHLESGSFRIHHPSGCCEKTFRRRLFGRTVVMARAQSVFCSTTDGDHRTAGQSEPNDEEQGKHRTRSNADSLDKTEEKKTHIH